MKLLKIKRWCKESFYDDHYLYEYSKYDLKKSQNFINKIEGHQFENKDILIPKIDVLNYRTVSLEYNIDLEGKFLFSSQYTKLSNRGKKVVGNYYTILSLKEKIGIIIRLCDIFAQLNECEIYINNLNEDIIIYDASINKLYLDLIPGVLIENSHISNSTEKEYVDYYLPIRKNNFKNDDKFRNNYYLSLLIFRILVGDTWFKIIPERDLVANFKKVNLNFNQVPNVPNILKDFYSDLYALLIGAENNQNMLLRYPSQWKKIITETYQCICLDGVFDNLNNHFICSSCGKEKLGYIECQMTHIILPLAFNHEYNQKAFQIGENNTVIFRTQSITKDNTKRYALFLPIDKEVYLFTDDGKQTKLEKTNSKNTYWQIDIDPETVNKFEFQIDSIRYSVYGIIS